MVDKENLDRIGFALFNGSDPSYFDLHDETVKYETDIVNASQDVSPERILFRFRDGDEFPLNGKMLIRSDDNFKDTSRYLPIPALSRAKECQDYVKLFCHDRKDLDTYQLNGAEGFEHNFSNFAWEVSTEESKYITRAYNYLDEKVSESVFQKEKKKYRRTLAMKWCDMHRIPYDTNEKT